MARRTKIVATIGPASSSSETLAAMVDAGLDVARIGMAHGHPDQHLQTVANIRKAAADRGRTIGVLVDMPGPKIRTTTMGDGVTFEDGTHVTLRSGDDPTTATAICTDYPTCAADLRVGDSVTLGDGGVDLAVRSVEGDIVHTEVTNGGMLKGRPGLHLPADRVSLPVPTDEDRMLIKEVVIAGKADFVAVSFVRSADEINEVRSLLSGQDTRIVAKIETPAAIDNLEEIVMASDAVMVARGDLGTECPFEDVPVYQKRIIRSCLAHSTPVITATQMLESMITASTPTRAEASDVANAVCDGTDAIMLSAESAIGADPVRAVATMAKIAERAEIVADFERIATSLRPQRRLNEVTAAVAHGARQAAIDAGAVAILCCTRSGSTARVMASLRPDTPLIALSTSPGTVHQETLTWGVTPVQLAPDTDINFMVDAAVSKALESGLVQKGDLVAVVSGSHDTTGSTDNFRLMLA
jgi:pyruvate kinase